MSSTNPPLDKLREITARNVAAGGAIYELRAACVECGDALDSSSIGRVCSPCIAEASEVSDRRTREEVAADVAAYAR